MIFMFLTHHRSNQPLIPICSRTKLENGVRPTTTTLTRDGDRQTRPHHNPRPPSPQGQRRNPRTERPRCKGRRVRAPQHPRASKHRRLLFSRPHAHDPRGPSIAPHPRLGPGLFETRTGPATSSKSSHEPTSKPSIPLNITILPIGVQSE